MPPIYIYIFLYIHIQYLFIFYIFFCVKQKQKNATIVSSKPEQDGKTFIFYDIIIVRVRTYMYLMFFFFFFRDRTYLFIPMCDFHLLYLVQELLHSPNAVTKYLVCTQAYYVMYVIRSRGKCRAVRLGLSYKRVQFVRRVDV